jgi:Kef-type K+ transport system membrane component KefB
VDHAVLVVDDLVAVATVSLLAPVVLGLLPRLPVPQVVLLLAGGVLIGPSVLGLSSPGGVQVLADVGLGFVFLLAGYEVDLRLFREDAGRRAVRQSGRLATVVRLGQHETAQITLRATILLLVALIAVTDEFHLDAVLGAFLAGAVLRHWVGSEAPVLESKLDAVGYGFFIPVFFVYSGMSLDLSAIAAAPLRLLLLLGLMLAVRGLPALGVYRGVLSGRQRVQTALITATALPVLVALAEIGLRNGTMLRENAAALVGAGVLTVLLFPALAVALERRVAQPAARADRPVRRRSNAPVRKSRSNPQ